VDSKPGEGKWKYETDGGINTSPLISDGVIYFGSQDNHYYAVDTKIAQELAPAEKAKEKELKEIENQRNVEADKNNITNDDIKIQYVSGEINLEEAIQAQSEYNKEEKLKLKWKEEAKNNIIRVNCEKTASLENMLILKGCLVLILDPDEGWAYGNHIKSQGGGTFAENHIIMKYTLDDDGSPNWEIAVGLWFGHNCSQDELIETASDLDGFDAIKAEAIFEVVYEIWSKYVEYGSDENPDYESTYLCQKSIIPNTKNDELWYAEDNFNKDNIMTTIDIESVSARVQGNMIFIS
jgi:FOG: WD40-like repeat